MGNGSKQANGIEADQHSTRFSGSGYLRLLLIWDSRYAVLIAKGCNRLDAKTPVCNLGDYHVDVAGRFLLHDA